ncbi:hypothetical protein GTP81_04775 [Rugamonas sp. FT107W]|uniref:Uncharacterized protein n=1 Tax=Duganella vulcania TaxID=2692166 RepID=A0A845HBN8_9BURK|nr:hypothetical protein [Duganella vulcania]MYN16058.1 hypothetical protein [Duganella vulcania]
MSSKNVPKDESKAELNLTRRRLIGFVGAIAVSFINPSRNADGNFSLIKPAEAWIQIAMLALSAISAFSKGGDGGLGAYLQNVKSLTEENIKLTQQVILSLGQLQSEVDRLPGRIRDIFIEVKGHELKQGTQKILDQISLIEINFKKNKKLSASEKTTCEEILDKCADLAGARSAIYGRGGTAAACIAVIGSVEARASWFLGRSADFRERISIAYLPWFEEIFKDQDGSLQRIFLQEGTTLVSLGGTTLDSLPDGIKAALAKDWALTIGSDPGSAARNNTVSCGSYSRHTGSHLGTCRQAECMGTALTSIENPTLKKILKGNELSEAAIAALSKKQNKTLAIPLRGPGDHCFCTDREVIPDYTSESTANLHVTLQNSSVDNIPQVILNTTWEPEGPKACPVFTSGEATDQNNQFLAARNSASASSLDQQIQNFLKGPLSIYNDQRAVVFTSYLLLDATRAACEQFKRVIK